MKNLLEGGQKAFTTRRAKYGFLIIGSRVGVVHPFWGATVHVAQVMLRIPGKCFRHSLDFAVYSSARARSMSARISAADILACTPAHVLSDWFHMLPLETIRNFPDSCRSTVFA